MTRRTRLKDLTQIDAAREMMRIIDAYMPNLVRMTLSRQGSDYSLVYEIEQPKLPLDSDSGGEIAGPQSTGALDHGQPITTMSGGHGPTIPPGNAGGNSGETGGDESTTSAPPEIDDDPFDIVVMVHDQDFRRDQVSAEIESGRGPYLQRQVKIETRDLPQEEWSMLMGTARAKQPVRLAVRLIVSGEHRTNRSRVVATQVIGAAQQSLF
jgi:hypothetical protein